jgi:hypothetical protein
VSTHWKKQKAATCRSGETDRNHRRLLMDALVAWGSVPNSMHRPLPRKQPATIEMFYQITVLPLTLLRMLSSRSRGTTPTRICTIYDKQRGAKDPEIVSKKIHPSKVNRKHEQSDKMTDLCIAIYKMTACASRHPKGIQFGDALPKLKDLAKHTDHRAR